MQELPEIDTVLIDALEHASEAFVIYDKDLNVVHCNGNFRDMYGYTEEQSKPGTPMRELVDLDVLNGNVPVGFEHYSIGEYLALRRTVEGEPGSSFEYQLNDGRWISINERPTSSGGIVSIQRDITSRKKIEEELLERNELFQTAFNADQSACSISVLETGEFLNVNDAWLRMRNLSRAEALGKTAFELNVWGSPKKREEVIRQVRQNKHKGRYETSVTRSDGTIRYFVLTWDVIMVKERECLFLSSTDITDQVDLEERLQQSQKMELIGQLTGGVAHDFNNLLAVIQGNSELLREAAEAGRKILPDQLDSILHAAKRGAELTQSMLAFSRKQTLNPVAIRLDRNVGPIAEMLRRTLGEAISVETDAEADLWHCEADEGKVETALLNLGVNARDAMPEGGKLRIWLRNCVLEASDLVNHPDVSPGRYVALSVEDTGSGISKENLEHVFEPFFTTKETGRGTGLGLSMVYGFAQQSRGHLTISSALDKGTTVTLYLPYADPSSAE